MVTDRIAPFTQFRKFLIAISIFGIYAIKLLPKIEPKSAKIASEIARVWVLAVKLATFGESSEHYLPHEVRHMIGNVVGGL